MTDPSSISTRAIGWPRAGSHDPPVPVSVTTPAPGAGQLTVRVVASALNPADLKVSSGSLVGRVLHARVSPLVLGYDFSGTVEAVGAGVDLHAGDAVFGHLAYAGSTTQGAFAERVTVDQGTLCRKPDAVPHDVAAAAATPGLTALQAIRDLGRLPLSGKVLIIGAAGGVGTLAVGVAKRLGATVTAVCSTYAVDFVRGLGADDVIDRRKKDPLTLEGPFDVVFDAAAAHSYLQCSHLLGKAGVYVRTLPDLGIGIGKLAALFSSKRCEFIMVRSVAKDLEVLAGFIADGVKVPIEARYPVRELQRGLDRMTRGEVRGRLVVDVEGGF